MVNVTTLEELYAAVNDPQNAGQTIALASGRYKLSRHAPFPRPQPQASSVEWIDPADSISPRDPRPNGGRLELQLDMSLTGPESDLPAVIATDPADPPSFTDAPDLVSLGLSTGNPGNTGLIRVGRGRNAIEWLTIEVLTIEGLPEAEAGIITDLVSPTAKIRVAHVTVSGSMRAVDIKNAGPAMAGRRIEAEIEHSVLSNNKEGLPIIRFANVAGAHGGQISALMNSNLVQGPYVDCVVTNHNSNSAIVDVRSSRDTFQGNLGCVVAGAITAPNRAVTDQTTTHSSLARFEAHSSKFQNCGLSGIVALGADMRVKKPPERVASNNAALVHLWNCEFSDNRTDIEAFSARSTQSKAKNNRLTIELVGENTSVRGTVTSPVSVTITSSTPDDTNWVTVVRGVP